MPIRVVQRLSEYVDGDTAAGSNVAMAAEIGLPSAEALVAFGAGPVVRGGHHAGAHPPPAPAVRRLPRPARRLQRTLLEAALRDGRVDLARSLIAERLAVRPTSAYAAHQLERLEASSARSEAHI